MPYAEKDKNNPCIQTEHRICIYCYLDHRFSRFKFYPFMSSLFYSFTNYNLFKESVENIGFANYEKIVDTAKYLKSYIVTFKYAFMTVPLKLLFALFIAYLLNFKIKGINLFRTAYYIPSILGGSVAIAVLWQFLFQNEGLVNTIIGLFGVKPVNWLGSPDYALFVICLLRVWQFDQLWLFSWLH